jgi:hypothetical protein
MFSRWRSTGPGADLKQPRDFLGSVGLCDELGHLLLARAQRLAIAHVLDPAPCGLLRVDHPVLQLLGGAPLQRLELEHDAGQRLTDLVVQLTREPAPLTLLGGERAAPTAPTRVLESIQHGIERAAQIRDLRVRVRQNETAAGIV